MKKVKRQTKTRSRKTSQSVKRHAKPKQGKKAAHKSGAKKLSTKIETLITMLRSPDGASIAALAKATKWQPHSVRGVISGTIKKKRGLKVTAQGSGGTLVYRIVD